MVQADVPGPGGLCQPDERRSGPREPHRLVAVEDDLEFQAVLGWLRSEGVAGKLRTAVDDAIRYILDGARTWRFDLMADTVDSDERSSVGTKLQYHVIEQLDLQKEPPLDTTILGLPVEIKGTVRDNWMIPREGQCELTLLIQIDAAANRFRVLFMRTHRAWLTGGKGNRDLKRSPRKPALNLYARTVVAWTDLPTEPLRLLTADQLRVVFGPLGQTRRLTALFGYLPGTVIPRTSIETVCATNKDVMRRARQAKPAILKDHGLVILVGKWPLERQLALRAGHDLGDSAWVGVPRGQFESWGYNAEAFLDRDRSLDVPRNAEAEVDP